MKHGKLIKFIEDNVWIGSYETGLIEKKFTPFTASKIYFLKKKAKLPNIFILSIPVL